MYILCLKGFRYDDFNEFLGQNWLDLDMTIILLLFPHQVIRIEHLSPPNGLLGLISSSSSTAFQLGLDKLILFTIVYVVVGPVFLDLVEFRFAFLRNSIVVLNFKLHQSLRVWSFLHAWNRSLIVDAIHQLSKINSMDKFLVISTFASVEKRPLYFFWTKICFFDPFCITLSSSVCYVNYRRSIPCTKKRSNTKWLMMFEIQDDNAVPKKREAVYYQL